MTAKQYLETKLEELKQPAALDIPENKELLVDAIFKLLMSKKFRKYAATPELQKHMLSAIALNVENNEPINLTFLHGAYKLWRFDEAPEADWAELFSLMYYSNWVKPVCAIYKPGVWFDFFVDDLIIPVLDNIEPSDVEQYLASYQNIMHFLKPYQPENLKMTVTPVGSQFSSPEEFNKSLQLNIKKVESSPDGGLPTLTDADKAMVELNTKATDEQRSDPQWREKVLLIHNAYMSTKAEPGYHNQPTKIKVFTQPLPNGMVMAVGSSKDSVAKFWVGIGALRPRDDSFRQIILTPNQLKEASYAREAIELTGLMGENFKRIRILS
ncbi:MAG TPA: hypothetical protein VK497_06270 [Candidatus Saccharimonadales bacterium]|nr:hypothetical protein [Candidatus Saccharimonadales bacterium]